jgi:capsular polysaccharide biosynthesis protein
MNKSGLIKECHHNYPIQYDYYLNEAGFYYYSALDNPNNLITLDNDIIYLTIHHPWFNYYHWICESIFRLWMVRKKLDKLTLLLPEFYRNADFITGSLEPFNITKIFYIPDGKSVLVRNLCLPQIKPLCDSYNSQHLIQIRNFYHNYVTKKKIRVDKIERLYISRQFAPRRKVFNEGQILKILRKYNFVIFYPEKHSFLEQVAIFSNVKYLVGTHGSGLTNMLFMKQNSFVLELHKNKTNELQHPSFLFWYMAQALDIKYFHQSCETYGEEDYFEGDYIIDAGLFEENVEKMISYSQFKT